MIVELLSGGGIALRSQEFVRWLRSLWLLEN